MNDTEFKVATEQRLQAFLEIQKANALTPAAAEMIGRLEQLILRAGKRSRPRLLKLTYDAYGGKHPEIVVDIGLALELQHQFLLVHDDIMDNDTVRYNGLNMLGYYRQEFPQGVTTIAESMALMAGNLLFTFANQVILEHPDLTPEQKLAVLHILHETNLAVHAGQQLDIVNVLALQPSITEETLLRTDFLKTALYSVRQPMVVAAELVGLKSAERKKIDAFARAFGILYQLVDDFSDYFSNSSSFDDHPKYRDYRQGKITYPLLYGLEHGTTEDVKHLRDNAARKNLTDEEMEQIAERLEKIGAKTAAQQQIKRYYGDAIQALDALAIDKTARDSLLGMLAAFSGIGR